MFCMKCLVSSEMFYVVDWGMFWVRNEKCFVCWDGHDFVHSERFGLCKTVLILCVCAQLEMVCEVTYTCFVGSGRNVLSA